MIVSYIRSSSVGTNEWCENKYFIEYVLGYKPEPHPKADMGNVVHKVMEVLALYKLALQKGETKVISDDFGELTFEQCNDIEFLHKNAVTLYPNKKYAPNYFEESLMWCHKAINYNDGEYDPRKLNVFSAEQFFDMVIDEPWAEYDYILPNGDRMKGNLALKGTMDLVIEHGDCLEILDWKSGKDYDWNKGIQKTLPVLQKDFQVQLYYYCAKKLYPDRNILFTINFINYGGPKTLTFEDSQLPELEMRIRDEFKRIKNNLRPVANDTWKCSKLCEWFKTPGQNNLNLCKSVQLDLYEIGMNKTVEKWTKDNTYQNVKAYGDGGGRRNKDD